jgi:hypothetical protein
MKISGQWDYLVCNCQALKNEGWQIFVDVDFYYQRPSDAIGFHKDTVGRTLFVNLNFNNTAEMLGPELVVNPLPIEAHLNYISDKLPNFFKDHLLALYKSPQHSYIGATKVPPYGIVSFVDELVHHSTPYKEHRGISIDQINQYINNVSLTKEAYASAYGENPEKFELFLKLPRTPDNFYSKEHLTINHGLPRPLVDALFKFHNKINMDVVNFAHCGDQCHVGLDQQSHPIRDMQKPILKRVMSGLLLTGNLPISQPDEKRQFLRTWVQVKKNFGS